MSRCLRAFAFLVAASSTLTANPQPAAQTPPINPIVFEQRQREVLLVRHLRQHVADPQDGLALAADLRDLRRLRAGSVATPPITVTPGASDGELVESVRVLADIWHARLVERTPFAMMGERLAALSRVQQAIGQLQSRGGKSGLDVWIPHVLQETTALRGAASGPAELSDQAVDLALRVADAAATGRPVSGPGPYPPASSAPGSERPIGPGPYPDAPAGSPGSSGPVPPAPPAGGPTPYSLPPAYEAYGAAASGVGGLAACQTLRISAGVSQAIGDMLRTAECWTRLPTWSGASSQALESLDWAIGLASIERDCGALDGAMASLREIGPRLSAGGLAASVAALSQQGESNRRRLRNQSLCK